ncbi:MAG: GTPase [Propionibacteriaceae bacterium]
MSKSGLATRVKDLQQAAELSQGRADAAVVAEALRVATQVDRRLAFAGDATVVALAGATGSGKSSTFNAVSGTQLARAGVRRPTTSTPMAATWGQGSSSDMNALLDWLEIPERHNIVGGDAALSGLVLLDLPDHDSTELSNKMQVDRLVKLVDMFVWVVDPQKYADAALHDHYLKPLAMHADVMMVVLNQADRVPSDELPRMLKDLRELLDSEGLAQAEVFAISAKTEMGIPQLQQRLASAVKDKKTAARRLDGDIRSAAVALKEVTGDAKIPQISDETIEKLSQELAVAAGADQVETAVAKAWRRRGAIATGWPVVSWLARLRPDPLRRLHLDAITGLGRSKKSFEPVTDQRTSLPRMGAVAKARSDQAIRTISDEASIGLPRSWADAVRAAARRDEKLLPDELDRAITRTDLGMESGNRWWQIVRVLQWLLLVTLVVGLGWLACDVVLAYFQIPALPSVYRWRGMPLPTLLAIGAAIGGVLLSTVCSFFVRWGARVKGRRAGKAVRRSIAEVTRSQIVTPVLQELDRYREVREALARMS